MTLNNGGFKILLGLKANLHVVLTQMLRKFHGDSSFTFYLFEIYLTFKRNKSIKTATCEILAAMSLIFLVF